MSTKKESERSKLVQEKCQNLITVMLKDEDNKYCVDCDAKGPRWASWNLGVFLCIRCAGIHRNLGVHITRVKSVNLDTWTPEQVASLQHMGNSRARAVYEAQLPDGFRRPQTDAALESFIRAKYEQKKYVAKEWVPSPAPKVDWDKEIDEELEKQKRKKKSLAAAGGGSVILGSTLSSPSVEKKGPVSKPTPIPAPLPKPKSSGHSPKAGRPQLELSNASAVLASPIASGATNGSSSSSNTLDLLGLSSPPPAQSGNASSAAAKDSSNNGAASDDEFNNFFSANSQSRPQQVVGDANKATAATAEKPPGRSLAQEEADFFNQSVPSDAEKAKLTKDSIMALYGSQPAVPAMPAVAPVTTAAPSSNVNLLAGLGVFPGQQHNGSFPAPQTGNANGLNQFAGLNMGLGQNNQKAGHFPVSSGPNPQIPTQFMNGGGGGFYHNGTGFIGVAPTNAQQQQGMNFFPGNGMGGFQPVNSMMMGGAGAAAAPGGLMGNGNAMFPHVSGMAPAQQPTLMPGLGGAAGSANGAAAVNMQQQFGNLNLGNVWQ